MAECKIPVVIDGYKCVEDMIQDVLNYTYKGKTLKEWANSISEPQTNADRIRSMTDEELAEWIANEIWKAFAQGAGNPFFNQEEAVKLENQEWLDWLKEEAE